MTDHQQVIDTVNSHVCFGSGGDGRGFSYFCVCIATFSEPRSTNDISMMFVSRLISDLPINNPLSKVQGKDTTIIQEELSRSSLMDFFISQGSVMDLEIIKSSTYNSILPRIFTNVELTSVADRLPLKMDSFDLDSVIVDPQ